MDADRAQVDSTQPRAPRSDAKRCVQTSFLVALIQRGPGALRDMVENYLRRYRAGSAVRPALRNRSSAGIGARSRGWDLFWRKIDDQTLTYDDLSVILTEMYDVYGSTGGGTSRWPRSSMLRREGYDATVINLENATQTKRPPRHRRCSPVNFWQCAVAGYGDGAPAGSAMRCTLVAIRRPKRSISTIRGR